MTKSSKSPPRKAAKVKARRSAKAIEKRDRTIARAVAVDEDSPAGRLVGQFAELGDQPPMQWLSGAIIAAGALRRDRKLFRAGLRMLGAHSLATLGKAFVKDVVDRTRPGEALASGRYKLARGHSHAHAEQSMPSGHSAGVVAVAAAATSEYPEVGVPASVAASALVGAQLPSRNHFLSDVAVGSAIGLAAFAAMRLLLPPLAEGEDGEPGGD